MNIAYETGRAIYANTHFNIWQLVSNALKMPETLVAI
jgi:hypothetical protein